MTTTKINYASFAHIAPGPYRLIGVETEEDREQKYADAKSNAETVEMHTDNMCGGTCAHCGTAIFTVFTFVASNGVKFKVGCDCAERALTGEDNLKALRAVDAAKKKLASKKRKALAERKNNENVAWIAEQIVALLAHPSPNEYRAAKGETAADWAKWMIENAGKAGVAKTRKTAELILSA